MLLNNKTFIEKNHILFRKNNNVYYHKLDGDNVLNIFNRPLTEIMLLQFEETLRIHVEYDDIIKISCLENHDIRVVNLPTRLEELYIYSSTLETIVFPPDIQRVSIEKSNINALPDISQCERLVFLKINKGNLTTFNLNLPRNLMELNLCGNNLTNKEGAFHFEGTNKNVIMPKKFKLNLNDNHFVYDPLPEYIKNKVGLLRQGTYKFNRITFRNVANDNIRNNIQNEFYRQGQGEGGEEAPHILAGGQTVHLSSINKSAIESVKIMKEYINTRQWTVKKYNLDNLCSLLSIKKGHKIIGFLEEQTNREQKHSVLKITYKELLEIVLCIAVNHTSKDDILERIKTEIDDSVGFCFTGIMNRLINSLVGFIDGIKVSISVKEEIQMNVQAIIKQYIAKKVKFREAMCQVNDLFDIPTDILVEEKISPEYKQSWIDGLEDYYEEDENDIVIKKVINDGNEEPVVFLMTWDDLLVINKAKHRVYLMDDKLTDLIRIDTDDKYIYGYVTNYEKKEYVLF